MSQDQTILNTFFNLQNNSESASSSFAILKLAVTNDQLVQLYQQKVAEHNEKFVANPFMDAGFDVFVPEETVFSNLFKTEFIDFHIKAEMVYCDVLQNRILKTGFTVHPRSSISKTPLMLANHTGIIDSGYRGSLIGAFRWIASDGLQYVVEKNTRLVQICHPTLCPIYVVLVHENELSNTVRGSGGFGSTGV